MIRLVFHHDEKSPTLHIHCADHDCADHDDVREMQRIFQRLAAEPEYEVELTALPDIEAEGVAAVRLTHIAGRSDFAPSVEVVARGEVRLINWGRGASGWDWCAELAESLSTAPPGRFQYLTQSASDLAEIELDYLAHL